MGDSVHETLIRIYNTAPKLHQNEYKLLILYALKMLTLGTTL